jgi:uncharacterized FlgJ-related protein
MTNTKELIEKFNERVDVEKQYTKNELCAILNDVYKDVYSKKKKSTVKREPTKYNIFVSENMKKLKEENPDLTRQDLMKKVGELWRETQKKQTEPDEKTEPVKQTEPDEQTDKVEQTEPIETKPKKRGGKKT